jgi:hypothetical protein
MESMPAINFDKAKDSAKQAVSTLQSAGSLVAKKAEETKIATITLPKAYGELGKVIYKEGSRRQEFMELFKAIDNLLADRRRIKEEAQSRPAPGTLAEKAKQVAVDASAVARKKAVDLQAFQVFAKLGEAVYQQHGVNAGAAAVVEPIANAVARRDQLNAEMSTLQQGSKGKWLTPKRIAWTVGIGVGLAVLGNLVGEAKKDDDSSASGSKEVVSGGVAPAGGRDDSQLNSLAAAAFEKAIAGMTPDQLQATFRATATKDKKKWGAFTNIKPSRTKEVKIEADVAYGFPALRQWYDTADVIECKFVKNVLSGKWELAAAWIGEKQVQLGAKPSCKAYCFDILHQGRTSNVILQVPFKDPTEDTSRVAYEMLKRSIRGEYKILEHGVIGW